MPPAYQSILLVTGLFLLFAGLLTAADVLGADFDGAPVGAFMWVSLVTGALALWPAFERNSAISLLLAALLGGVALLTAWSWLFDANSAAAVPLAAGRLLRRARAVRRSRCGSPRPATPRS